MWEGKTNIYNVFELRCKTTCYFGVGAINKIKDTAETIKEMGIDRIIIITDEVAYKVTGAWDVIEPQLKKTGIDYILYTKVTSNPTIEQIDKATKMGREFGAKAVIGIGGESPIDTAKSVAILLEYADRNARELYEQKFMPVKAKPIIAINTTHGTGTEKDFGVMPRRDL